MEKINSLIFSLLAIQNFCKDIHYNAKGDAFYSKHLLVDRIQENISDYIDSIKEVCFLAANKEPLPSSQYLTEAAKLIPLITADDTENFRALSKLIFNALKIIENPDILISKGEENLLGAIAENLQTSLGLVYQQIKG